MAMPTTHSTSSSKRRRARFRCRSRPEWKTTIRANLEMTLKHAALVDEFPLPDEAEPAPIFKA